MKDFSYLNRSATKQNSKIRDLILKQGKSDDLLKKSAIPTGMEKQENMPGYEESLNQIKKQRRKERAQTKGRNWFDMQAPEMTEEKKNDLMVLQMRRSLDPKRFYKAPDIRALPKFFEMGTVIESAADFYSSRIPKKQRKKTLVDELLADQEFRSYNKRKYQEIQESKMRGRGAYKRMKRLKKNKR